MRYYDLKIEDPVSKQVIRRWTSHPETGFNPSALNVEFDMITADGATPVGPQTIIVEGISLTDLSQNIQYAGKDLSLPGMNFSLKAGMKEGLPLSNPKQAGLITSGTIFQSFGNWEGTNMSLSFIVSPSQYSTSRPGQLIFNWKAGQELSDALRLCFEIAYPNIPININIKSGLVQNHDEPHYCNTLETLAQKIKQLTTDRFNNPVYITMQNGAINIYDYSVTNTTIQINWTDLIGQPVWVDVNHMQFKAVLRGDISLGSTIKMPKGMQNAPGIVQTTQQSYSSMVKYKTAFQGDFFVNKVRQLGNYRSPDGASWVTIVDCLANV